MRLFSYVFVFSVMTLLSNSAYGQPRPTPTPVKPANTPVRPLTTSTGGTKIALIFSGAFEDPKAGITKFVAALDSVEASFRKELDDLNASVAKMRALDQELIEIKRQAEVVNPAVPVNRVQLQTTFTAKSDEMEKLGREYKFRQDDLKARFQKKRQEVVGPILIDIGKAMTEFGKMKGFTMILDGGRLQDLNILLGIGDETADVTRDFIIYYNAKSATPVTK